MSASCSGVPSDATVVAAESGPERRTAWVSGASSGLGRAIAELLIADGYDVWGTARAVDRLAGWSGEPRFHPVALDLRDRAGAATAFLAAQRAAGGAFTVCVQNAGFGEFGAFAAADPGAWEDAVAALLFGTARLSRLALQGFATHPPARGTLVHVSSLAVEFPLPLMSGYNVAKAGLSALSESLIVECRGTGVTVIDFRPGDTRTPFNQAMRATTALDHALEQRIWARLERNLAGGPAPETVARDLIRALRRGRSGVVRSGSFFQARLGPLLARLAPGALRRRVLAQYFGLS